MEWNQLLPLAGAVGATWLLLVMITHLAYWRRIGRSWAFWNRTHLVPYATASTAWQAADDRRQAIRKFIRGRSSNWEPIRYEFAELPPQLAEQEYARADFNDDDLAAAWHLALLRTQQVRDEYLLAERFIDSLIFLQRVNKLGSEFFPICIRLEKLPWWLRAVRGDLFSWRVVVVSNHPSRISELLSGAWVEPWFCIGVDVVPHPVTADGELDAPSSGPATDPPPSPQPSYLLPTSPSRSPVAVEYAQCRANEDVGEGVVAGVFRNSLALKFAITCRHVACSKCNSVLWPTPVRPPDDEFTQQSPDAALLKIDNATDCFDVDRLPTRPIADASNGDVRRAVREGSLMSKSHDAAGALGLILCADVRGFQLGQYFYHGPHFELAPNFRRRFWLIWPWSRRFAGRGDSGCWIINQETRSWMGMLVGGFEPPNTTCYAISSEYILAFFRSSNRFPEDVEPELIL